MPGYRKKVCRECGRVYLRQYVRTSGTLGWCGPNCYMKDYQRRREGKAAGEPPDPVDDSAIQEPRVIEALAYVLRGDSMEREAMVEKQSSGEFEDDGEIGEFHLDVVADRAFVPQTRFGEDNSVGVEWVGRCWVWLTDWRGADAHGRDGPGRRGRQAVGTGRGASCPSGPAERRNTGGRCGWARSVVGVQGES